ncbi:hypothetical protein FQA39_LY12126 [Lamprigera yunnana]|nr:hypothetical protein FQA39_LY12126 [Lamprigera yunnana]
METIQIVKERQNIEHDEEGMNTLEPENFIIAKFCKGKFSKKFVRKILCHDGNDFTDTFLRENSKIKNAFIYPRAEDKYFPVFMFVEEEGEQEYQEEEKEQVEQEEKEDEEEEEERKEQEEQ